MALEYYSYSKGCFVKAEITEQEMMEFYENNKRLLHDNGIDSFEAYAKLVCSFKL